MTITPFEIYLISKANMLLGTWLIGFLASLTCIIYSCICRFEDKHRYIREAMSESKSEADRVAADIKERDICVKMWSRMLHTSVACMTLSLILLLITPATKTLIAMYTIPQIVNNSEMQKIPENLLRFVNAYLEKEEDKK